jgi:hypothetical protein
MQSLVHENCIADSVRRNELGVNPSSSIVRSEGNELTERSP